MPPTDAVLAALQRLLAKIDQMTPGPWEFRNGNDANGDSCDLLMADIAEPGDGDPEYAEVLFGQELSELERSANWGGIAALRNVARPLLEALIALQAERHLSHATHKIPVHDGLCLLRLNVDDDPQFFDRLYALQEASDAALQRLAEALEVQP